MTQPAQDRFYFFFMAGLALVPLLAVYTPRALAFAPMVLGMGFSAYWVYGLKNKLSLSRPYLYWVLAIGGLWGLSSLWAFDAGDVWAQTLTAIPLLMLGVFPFSLALALEPEKVRPYLWLFPAGVALAATFTAIELAFDMPVFRIIHAVGPERHINTSVMNRTVVTLTLLALASGVMVFSWEAGKNAKLILGALLCVSLIGMLGLTQSETGQLVIATGLLVYALFPYRHPIAFKVVSFLLALALLSTPWLAQYMFTHFASSAAGNPWLKDAYAASRMEIWDFVSRYALQRPFCGFGLRATRMVESFGDHFQFHDKPSVLHPHNFAVQLWMEFGVIGALFASAFFAFVIHKISLVRDIFAKRIGFATLISTIAAASISYGLWQGWWLGEFVFLFALSALLMRVCADRKSL